MGPAGRIGAITAAALAAGASAVAPNAVAALTAQDITLRGTPAAERVVVSFSGARLSGLERQVDAPDLGPGDGRAAVRVNGRGITSVAAPASRAGVRVRVGRRPGSIVILITAPRGDFKFVSYRVAGRRDRLVIDLWRATTSPAAAILDDGCLRLTGRRGGARPAVRGLELTPLFEHTVVASLRAAGAGESTLALNPLTATGFRFRPDFSGYLRPGRFAGPIPVTVTAPLRVMLEAWSASAKDGSLDCLVQAPVLLTP